MLLHLFKKYNKVCLKKIYITSHLAHNINLKIIIIKFPYMVPSIIAEMKEIIFGSF